MQCSIYNPIYVFCSCSWQCGVNTKYFKHRWYISLIFAKRKTNLQKDKQHLLQETNRTTMLIWMIWKDHFWLTNRRYQNINKIYSSLRCISCLISLLCAHRLFHNHLSLFFSTVPTTLMPFSDKVHVTFTLPDNIMHIPTSLNWFLNLSPAASNFYRILW